MTALVWDKLEERFFETGTDHGVLYMPTNGEYATGVAWNGLTGVTQSPSGAEPTKQYADNIPYVTMMSYEEFGGTIEAFTFPDEFEQYNGVLVTAAGMRIGQQKRGQFGFSFRTKKGSAADEDLGYKIHLLYGCQASPSEKAYKTVNDTPEPLTFSWSLTTTPVPVTGYKPTSYICIDSTDPRVSSAALAAIELILYGTTGVDPRLPLPDEIATLLDAGVQLVTPTAPSYNSTTDIITIPATTGVIYSVNGVDQPAGAMSTPITANTVVNARPAPGYSFTGTFVTQWLIVLV
jgi:hypothetical protein